MIPFLPAARAKNSKGWKIVANASNGWKKSVKRVPVFGNTFKRELYGD